MTDLDQLGQQLQGIEVPASAGARQRALAAAQREVIARHRQGVERRRPGHQALAVGVVVLAVAAAVAFTPPGRAAAEWVAERFGIGEPGGPPSQQTFREFANEGTIAEGAPAYVLARGPTPHGGHYEFITYKSNRDGSRCFEFDVTDARGRVAGTYGGGCSVLLEREGLRLDSSGASIDPSGQGLQSIAGRVSEDVESVDVDFNGRLVETELTPVPTEVVDALGMEAPFKVYVAFIEDFTRGGVVEVTARDQVGSAAAQAELEIPNYEATYALFCKEQRRQDQVSRWPQCQSG